MSWQSLQLKKLNGRKIHRLSLIYLRKFSFLFAISICAVDTLSVNTLYVHFLMMFVLYQPFPGTAPHVMYPQVSELYGKARHSRKPNCCSASLLPPGTGLTASPAAQGLVPGPRLLPGSLSHKSSSTGPQLCPMGAWVELQLQRCGRPSQQVYVWGCHSSGNLQLKGLLSQQVSQRTPPQLPGHSYKTFLSHAAYFLTSFPSPLPFHHKSLKQGGFCLSHLEVRALAWEHFECTALQAKAMRMSGARL